MSRSAALQAAVEHFDNGAFARDLARRVAIRTESQEPSSGPALQAYLADEMAPTLAASGFACRRHANPDGRHGPLLTASRHEGDALPTVLIYGHGDVVRGQDASWKRGRGRWTLAQDGERLYGRGSADNKGQHSSNIAALAQVLQLRGRLGFNVKWLIETGEETGSPGLADFCSAQRAALAADVLIASDGPRLRRDRPTVFLGSLEHAGGAGDAHRQPGLPGQRDTGQREGGDAHALRRRHRCGQAACGGAGPPGRTWLRRHPGPAHRLGAAQLPGLQPARARRAPAGAGGARGAGADDGAVLGPRRAGRHAAAPRAERRAPPCCAR